MTLIFYLLRSKVSLSSQRLIIRMILFMILPAWSTDWRTHRGTRSSTPPTQLNISLYFLICSETELLMGQLIVKWLGRGSSSRGSHPFPLSDDRCYCLICVRSWCTWLLKGMGDGTRSGLIYVFGQNTPMTNSESKYSPFVLCASLCSHIICR